MTWWKLAKTHKLLLGKLPGRPARIVCTNWQHVLYRHKLEPMVTLHHFVHPNWFENLGGFIKEENIPIFVEFARTAFRYV